MNMTANRLILLLQIYRGLQTRDMEIGTFTADLRMLAVAGLVDHRDGPWRAKTTDRGDAYVKKLLGTEP